MVRLDKYLCDCNIGSRSEVKKILKMGCITVNQKVIKDPAFKIDEQNDIVTQNGKTVNYEKYTYLLFHKPSGCVTANKDQLHKTVIDYLPKEYKHLSCVGRLDLDTEGLLLITNDGELNHHLVSPSHHVWKTYLAYLDCPVLEEKEILFQTGIDINDEKLTMPSVLKCCDETVIFEGQIVYPVYLSIQEGRFHQVKRMFHAVGCEVLYLKRCTMGTLELGNLPKGEYRKLTQEEIQKLKEE